MNAPTASVDACGRDNTDPAPECCTWCGLPVAGVTRVSEATSAADSDAVYCCFGCRMAHAITEEKGQEGAVRWTIVRLGISIFFSMNLMAFSMTMWSLDVYQVQRDPFQTQLFEVFRWLSMILSLPVLLLLGGPLLQSAVASWKQRIYSTDLLIAIGVTAAYFISAVNVIRDVESVYFEVGATVLVMVTLGRWFEAVGKQKATEALDKLAALLPEKATRQTSDGFQEISSTEIQVGDRLQIRAGDRFPTDALLVEGTTTVDEQIFTGESSPVEKDSGQRLLGGTVNLDGHVLVEALSAFRGGSFGRLLQLLQEARLSRGHYQRLADRASAWFLPLITGIALLTLAFHWQKSPGIAVQHSLSVLLIACPCALGLATPLAVWTALSTAARHQVLFRSGESVERLAVVKAVCFDKTGTLTTGTPQVRQLILLQSTIARNVLPTIRELCRTSTHPFSHAVARYSELPAAENAATDGRISATGECRSADGLSSGGGQCGVHLIRSDSIRSISGGGIEAMDENGDVLRLGSTEFVSAGTAVREDSHPELRNAISLADAQAASVVAFSVNSKPLTLFLLTESLRPGASQTIRQCLASGLPVSVLTGDRPARAEQLQRHLTSEISGNRNDAETCLSAEVSAAGSSAIDCSTNGSQRFRPDHVAMLTVESSLKPDLKVRRVTEIRQQHGAVAMVGDGINDAPALAVSDIGIAMGCGADVSRDSAQVCLLSNDLTRIPWAIHLARQTRRVIRQNLFWAFGYNSAGVALAAFGLLNPAVAAGLMIVSSLLVISNSLRLMAESPEDSRTDRISEEQILSRTVASGTGGVQRIPTVDTLRAGGLA